MTNDEYIAKIKTVSNEELIKTLDYCGHDGYYNEIYYPTLEELCKRLGVNYKHILYD